MRLPLNSWIEGLSTTLLIAGMRSPVDGMAFMLCNLTATQSKTYLGRASDSSGGGLKIKEIEGGRHSLPHRGHEAAEVASVLDKGFEDGAVHGN